MYNNYIKKQKWRQKEMAKLFGYRWYQTNRQLLMGHADMPWSIDDKSFEAIENPGCAITYKTFKSTNGYVRRISVFLPIDFGKFLRSTPENQKHLECHEPNLVEKQYSLFIKNLMIGKIMLKKSNIP